MVPREAGLRAALPLHHRRHGARVAFLERDGLRVEIFELRDSSPMPDKRREPATNLSVHGRKHVALAVEDLEAVVAELGGRGVEFATGVDDVPGSGGERFAFFRDNNGNLMELYQPVPENGAGVRGEGRGRGKENWGDEPATGGQAGAGDGCELGHVAPGSTGPQPPQDAFDDPAVIAQLLAPASVLRQEGRYPPPRPVRPGRPPVSRSLFGLAASLRKIAVAFPELLA